MDPISIAEQRRKQRVWAYGLGVCVILTVLGMGAIAIIPVISPSAGAGAADLVRAALGPDAVANLETASFRIQDAASRGLYAVTGSRRGITLGNRRSLQSGMGGGPLALLAPRSGQGASGDTNALTAQPQIGWQAYGPNIHGRPVMAQALLNLDPQRPYAGIALVRLDLAQLQLHMMPGFLEPSHDGNLLKAIPNPGLTPASDVSHLVAAFNGGFKAVNGHYGMMVDGVTLLPPVPGIATIAMYRDGRIQIGTWGTDIVPSPDMVAYRQNCPPIIQTGQINPQVTVDNRLIWGSTIGNKEITWRTGVGLSQDGRYLIYAVGNATTISTLAEALQQAGAYNAMQLDINQHYAHFVTYQAASNGSLSAVPLLNQMENIPTLYLVAHSRDYFYLTTKSG
jgi:hypothetical protein